MDLLKSAGSVIFGLDANHYRDDTAGLSFKAPTITPTPRAKPINKLHEKINRRPVRSPPIRNAPHVIPTDKGIHQPDSAGEHQHTHVDPIPEAHHTTSHDVPVVEPDAPRPSEPAPASRLTPSRGSQGDDSVQKLLQTQQIAQPRQGEDLSNTKVSQSNMRLVQLARASFVREQNKYNTVF